MPSLFEITIRSITYETKNNRFKNEFNNQYRS